MKLLVIIVSYNFERWMEPCLGSLKKSELKPDIIVIDNASQDRTVNLIESRYPEVRLLKNDRNLGFGAANNIGLKIAIEEGYDAVFLMNQDTWIDSNVLGTLAELSRLHPEYGIISPVHLGGNGRKLMSGFARYSGLGEGADKEQIARNGSPAEVVPISFVSAAFWLIPVSVLRKVGGFCPLFYHYGEDVDYINRVHYHGYLTGYSTVAFGCHDCEGRKNSREKWLHLEEVYHLSEYANINYSFIKAFGYGIVAIVKKALQALLRGKMADFADFVKMTFRLLGRTGEINRWRRKNKLYAAVVD